MDNPLRIALISEHASPAALLGGVDAGGQNVYMDELSRNLAARGHSVDVYTRRDALDVPAVRQWAPGVRIVSLGVGPERHVPKDDLWPLMPAFRDAIARFAGAEGARYDVLHGNFWMSGWVAAELGDRWGAPVAQIFHATGLTKRRHQGEADTSPPERVDVERDVVRRVERLIAQCPAERDELVDDYNADPARVALIPSAVNVELFRPVEQGEARWQIGLEGDAPTVAYVGRMLPRKDPRNIVRALALLRHELRVPARLLLVGGETSEPDPEATPEIGALQRLARELRVDEAVAFYGRRQPGELRLYYGAADVVVTTPWYEPFGLTPLEAMACGRPVIGSAVGGITYTIADGETGLLVPARDPAALAAALRQLLMNPERRVEMGRAARRRVEREFTWPVVAHRTEALYRELLAATADRRLPTAEPIVVR
jgi:D-inositol-3-phosphate glycosyltransferase